MGLAAPMEATEFHVAKHGNDANPGTRAAPLRSIQRAAILAQAGDIITVHEGVYRERINPPRGGSSERNRITYQAAPGERVEIKGSETVRNWVKLAGEVWKVTLPNSFFGTFNPYSDLIHGDWFNPKGRSHHSGAVYLDGKWLVEAPDLDSVLKGTGTTPLWFGKVEEANTTIWAQFRGVNPNEREVEINVRQTIFYPDRPGRNYITVRGFTMRHAATPWAPPTAEQIGLIGTHWSKGWIIEENSISHSTCTGVSLGKYGDEWDNTSANTAEGYVLTIERALKHGWNKETIGHHIVRNNNISHCEQAGIVGSLDAAFSTITGNTIHDIHVRQLFSGAEMAGIKFHGAIDTAIRSNHIYRTVRGLWLDWMAQGTRVSGNFLHDNASEDLFVEVNHGPFLVDNNLFLSRVSLLDMSEGGAYAHNLFAGKIVSWPEPGRATPFHRAHTTAIAGLATTKGGDNRFYNNIFLGNGMSSDRNEATAGQSLRRSDGFGLWVYDNREGALRTGGNVYLSGAQPYFNETNLLSPSGIDGSVKLATDGDRFALQLAVGTSLKQATTRSVTTALLGKAKISGLPYENPDGSRMKVNTDYLGRKRSSRNPTAGPFETSNIGPISVRVW